MHEGLVEHLKQEEASYSKADVERLVKASRRAFKLPLPWMNIPSKNIEQREWCKIFDDIVAALAPFKEVK